MSVKYFETNKVVKSNKYLETEVGTYQHNSDQSSIGMLLNDISRNGNYLFLCPTRAMPNSTRNLM
jgi:hypothetical protein